MASPAPILQQIAPAAPVGGLASAPAAEGLWARQRKTAAFIYWGIHASCLLALFTGVSALDLLLCFGLFYLRLLAITGAYHRYFSHRSFKTSRAFQLVMAVVGCAAVQKGPLWWAAGHRRHHRHSDQPGDMHSPRDGFWHAHQGWILDGSWETTETERISDLIRYPELVWLNRWHVVPALALAAACFAIGGLSGLVWGFAISTTLLWHSTYTINSLAHRWGRQRYETGDDSRNNPFLALLTLGEGWHNNHHKFQSCARQGFFWWEIDITWYVLKLLERVGLVWELREPPERLLDPASFAGAARPDC
jgi:stearoyl-CoA desaturase (delta-9 desaturase)